MSSSRLVPFVVEMTLAKGHATPVEWRTKVQGKPNNENLAKDIAFFEASCRPGGVNAHLGETVVTSARIIDQKTGAVRATYVKA
jgi:hypothetical protein